MEIFLWIAVVVLFILLLITMWALDKMRQQRDAAIDAGLILQSNAIENDAALRKGLDDQMEAYEQDYLTMQETIEKLQKEKGEIDDQLATCRSVIQKFLTRIAELERDHQNHSDHCLPVLTEMRKASA